LEALKEYEWPGNIRELENTIERAVVLSQHDGIELEDLMYHGISAGLTLPGKLKTLEDMEKEYIRAVLRAQYGNKTRAAEILDIDRKTLWAKIKKYKI
ncbi:MAG: sigma-54-dependent Fis family transcriptional regulator, partial [Candidatus Aminicenantes bacterium]|nr:sigma-54-dependent Fis family transcriptional regulator [Candidatus Aminicenantes bacterium]